MGMTAELKGNKLVVTIDTNDLKNLPLSASGKTSVVASSHGNTATSCIVAGKPVVIGLNAYIK